MFGKQSAAKETIFSCKSVKNNIGKADKSLQAEFSSAPAILVPTKENKKFSIRS